jgi:hypothetical protein
VQFNFISPCRLWLKGNGSFRDPVEPPCAVATPFGGACHSARNFPDICSVEFVGVCWREDMGFISDLISLFAVPVSKFLSRDVPMA